MPRASVPAILTFALAAAFVAGCVTPPAAEADPASASGDADWWMRAIPSIETKLPDGTPIDAASFSDHDHNARDQHAGLTTPNFEVLGFDPLVTAHYGTTLTGMGCGGSVERADGIKLAVVHSISTDVSFVVADVTDPAAPVMMGEYYMPNAVVWDADISADGMHVLVGAYPYAIFGGAMPTLPPGDTHGALALAASLPQVDAPDLQIKFRSACSSQWVDVGPESYFPFGPGIVMIGVQDPANPTFEDWKPQPAIGPHSVGSQMIDGTVWATASVTNLNHEASYYSFFHIVDTPVGGKLAEVAHIEAPGVRSDVNPLDNGHIDVFLQTHPVTGQLLAYLANWNAGMAIYDMSLPVPHQVALWMNGEEGNIHTTYPYPMLVDDKQYLVVGQEVGEPETLPSGWVYILDVTDPAAPTEVGRWTLPIKPVWGTGKGDGGLMFSPHYVGLLNETLFVSNYHGGLWAVDVSDPANMQAVGIFVPDRDSPAAFDGGAYGPGIEDVIVDPVTGTLTTWDNAGGVYLLRYDASKAMPAAPSWPHEGHGHE